MTTTTPVFLQQNDEESSAKRKDGSEERMIFSENVQAAYNDTSLDENGQESAISVVSKVRSSMPSCMSHWIHDGKL
jgi:hypothetical protein